VNVQTETAVAVRWCNWFASPSVTKSSQPRGHRKEPAHCDTLTTKASQVGRRDTGPPPAWINKSGYLR